MSYKVGDILWVVGREIPGVRVYQVVEELTKKTLTGTITTYTAQTPTSSGKLKKVNLDSLSENNDIFASVEEAKKKMFGRFELAINKMINGNKNLIRKYLSEEQVKPKIEEKLEEGNMITLPDGTKARVKINLGEG